MLDKQDMNAKKLSFGRAGNIAGLICLAGLMLFGFTEVRDRSSISQLRQAPPILDVSVFQQQWSTSCGEAVIAMVYNYAYPESPLTEEAVIEYASANGYYTPDLYPYTSPANMVKIAKYYAEDVASGNVLIPQRGLALLTRHLRRDDPVIIDVLSDFSDPESEAHFVVVTGISVDPGRGNAVMIHYNDPLTGTAEVAGWLGSQGVWNAWRTNGDPGGSGWWMVIPRR